MNEKQVKVTMTDFFADDKSEVIERVIDISIFYVPDTSAAKGWECDILTTDKDVQRDLLNLWIRNRANSQHETSLVLKGWEII